MIGALAGGSFADRVGYRTTSVISDAASGVTVLALGLLAQFRMLPLWALLALVFLSNLMDAPGSGARASQIPDLTRLAGVPLTRSTGIRSTIGRLATMLGSAAAGVVVSLASPDMALYINAVCFLVSIAVTLLMVPSDAALRREGVRGTTAPVSSDGMSLRDFFAGAAFIVRTPLVRAIVMMVVLTNLLDSAAMNVLWALYARTVSSDDAWYGVMTAILAAGMPFGSVLAGYLGQSMPLPLAFAIIGGCYAGVFALTGFGRHWRGFDESFRHATEV